MYGQDLMKWIPIPARKIILKLLCDKRHRFGAKYDSTFNVTGNSLPLCSETDLFELSISIVAYFSLLYFLLSLFAHQFPIMYQIILFSAV